MAEPKVDQNLHIGLILDGNRRWAKARSLPVIEGHRQGYKNLKRILKELKRMGVCYITVYAFSTENWNRSSEEVGGLMKLLKWVLTHELKELSSEQRRVVFLGSRDNISSDILKLVDKVENETEKFTGGTLAICFNYGGQQEVVEAVQKLVRSGLEITVESISAHLYHPEIPPIDLLVRTSGEQRTSNFMLWRSAYAELAFTDTLWPDFTSEELQSIIQNYLARHRRFGT
jgi:undecaprenyl diphosphate synthase